MPKRTVIIGRNAGRYSGHHGGRSGRIRGQVHRRQIENHDRRAAISDEQRFAVGAHFKPIRAGHWIDAVGAGGTALRAGESAEVMVGAKTLAEMEGGPSLPG